MMTPNPITAFLLFVTGGPGVPDGDLSTQDRRGIDLTNGAVTGILSGLMVLYILPKAVQYCGSVFIALLVSFLPLAVPLLYKKLIGRRFRGGPLAREFVWAGLFVYFFHTGVALMRNGGGFFTIAGLCFIPMAGLAVVRLFRSVPKQRIWRLLGLAIALAAGLWVSNVSASIAVLFLNSQSLNLGAGLIYGLVVGAFLYLLKEDFLTGSPKQHGVWELVGLSVAVALWLGMSGLFTGAASAEFPLTALSANVIANFFNALLLLTRETALYLVLGLVISGLLHAYMPGSPVDWLKRGKPLTQSLKGMAFGLPLPICSCGVLPLFLSLSKKGVPPACLTAFLIATPELGVDSFLLSVTLLGWKFSTVRLVIAIVLPVIIALTAVALIKPQLQEAEPVKSCCSKSKQAKGPSWWRFAFQDLADDIFPFVFFGLTIAALAQVLWPEARFQELTGFWDVILLGLLGIPFYVCASASVPFALVLLNQGFSVGAVVVFLFAGPATNVATVMTVNKAFGPGSGLKLASIAFVTAVAFGFLINGIYTPESLDLVDMHQHGWSMIDVISLVALLALAVYSLGRIGPLEWLTVQAGMVPGLKPEPESQSSCH